MNQVATIQQPPQELQPVNDGASLMQAIARAASDPTVDVDKMERMFAMYEKMQDRSREQLFAEAMSEAQRRMPRILKDKTNKQTNSLYAALESILAAITPIYTDCGFSLSFGSVKSDLEKHVGITCDVLHSGGHVRSYHYDAPIDDEGIQGNKNKTLTHGRGSAISYGRRYLTCMIFNLTVGGEDNDGNGVGAKIDDVAQDWINLANELDDPADYKARRAEVAKAYGGPTKVPAAVATAFAEASKRVLPKD